MNQEQLFNRIDDLARSAAETDTEKFEAEAWHKMEQLLNKNKRRRRTIFWLWLMLPLLLISGILIIKEGEENNSANQKPQITSNFGNKQTTKQDAEKNDEHLQAKNPNISSGSLTPTTATTSRKITAVIVKEKQIAGKRKVSTRTENLTVAKSGRNHNSSKRSLSKKNDKSSDSKDNIRTSEIAQQQVTGIVKAKIFIDPAPVVSLKKDEVQRIDDGQAENHIPFATVENVPMSDSSDTKTKSSEALKAASLNKETLNKKNLSKFFVRMIGGAEVTSTRFPGTASGKISLKYGASLGYQLNSRWSLQSGINFSNKIYTAQGKDYLVKPGSYLSQYEIEEVKAACLIAEIPILLQFNFIQRKKINWYAVAGLSSFLMKKEKYVYRYKIYGQTRTAENSYTGNKHVVSNLIWGTGLERSIGKGFRMQIEPSLSIPLYGVGEGKVKLFSASILAGLKYFPFQK